MVTSLKSQAAEEYFVRKSSQRTLVAFLDEVMLYELTKRPLSGYDAIACIRQKYGFLLSSGTVYATIYSLERKGFIECAENERKRTYRLTEKGKQMLEILQTSTALTLFRRKILNLDLNKENPNLNVNR